jgi:DNA (cytosine-5)-methyltransferase 1
MKQLTHAGFFEGIGGFSLGAERAGFETIYTCELDDFRNEWLETYLPNAIHERDIKTSTGCYADIFTAGFPCQDISIANQKGKGLKGSRSGLFFEFIHFVRLFRPKYVILENSPMLVYSGELLQILREFAECGYDAEWQLISKRSIGYPDERERFILVAYCREIERNENIAFFTKQSFEIGKKALNKGKFLFNQLSRMDNSKNWLDFITKSLQIDTGISKELAEKQIASYGDAICPDVAQLIFELIKIHLQQ